MADHSKKDQATAQFHKLQRVDGGKPAMSEYESEAAAVRAKTERLRALRLAREAEGKPAAVAAPAKKKPAKKIKAKAGSLADWLAAQQGSGRNS